MKIYLSLFIIRDYLANAISSNKKHLIARRGESHPEHSPEIQILSFEVVYPASERAAVVTFIIETTAIL